MSRTVCVSGAYLAEEQQIKIDQRPFSIEDACNANEAFITPATTFVMRVVSINGKVVADGRPGKLT